VANQLWFTVAAHFSRRRQNPQKLRAETGAKAIIKIHIQYFGLLMVVQFCHLKHGVVLKKQARNTGAWLLFSFDRNQQR
jgi:hypothetical protein